MISETLISSLGEFAAFAAAKACEDKPYWFRGVRNGGSHDLIASLYRHPGKSSAEDFRELEIELMALFRHRAPPFHEQIPTDPMDLLFLMQHHGVPTRLLDWSENPYIALFFSLEVALWEPEVNAVDSAVWMIDPTELNRIAFPNNDGSDRILSASDDLLNAYKPNNPTKNSGKSPIAIYGVHNSRRIVAQRGVFVLHGSSTLPMNKDPALIDKNELMHKITIRKDAKKPIARALFNMGITDSVIYPDLDGLGREIKNRMGFWGAKP
jgi:hypothetical protein